MNDIMIDIETAGNRPGSAILTLGAVAFDATRPNKELLNAGQIRGVTFYERISFDSASQLGLRTDPDTLIWWFNQSREAQAEAFRATPRKPLAEVLDQFSRWLTSATGDRASTKIKSTARLWANSPSFDIVLLESAFQVCRFAPPWHYWHARDLRTLLELAGISHKDKTSPCIPHHALYDAMAQAYDVQRAWAAIHTAPGSGHA